MHIIYSTKVRSYKSIYTSIYRHWYILVMARERKTAVIHE